MTKTILLLTAAIAAPAFAQAQQAAPQAQPVTRAAYQATIDQGFTSVDTNKDGFADKTELDASERKKFDERKAFVIKQRSEAFAKMDLDKNGSVTLKEFNSAVVSLPFTSETAKVMTSLDANKDGKVSATENRTPAMAEFDKVDTNKDGTVSLAEQQAAARPR